MSMAEPSWDESDFGITDNFWLVGGHSLAAAGLVARIEQELGRSIPVEAIFRCPTITGQANWLLEPSSHSSSQWPGHLVALQPLGSRPPLHVVHGWGGRVGAFTNLARALAPHRPMLGLQASSDGSLPQETSVTQLAAAYAVVAALLERQASVGLLAIFDTHATTRIHRRLGFVLFSRMLIARLIPNLRGAMQPPAGQSRRRYVLERLRAANARAAQYLQIRIPASVTIKRRIQGMVPPSQEAYVQLLTQGYRPPRLPLTVHLFAPKGNLPALKRLWRFYAKGGVHSTALFVNHHDFYKPELVGQLAQALEATLQRLEQSPSAPLPVTSP